MQDAGSRQTPKLLYRRLDALFGGLDLTLPARHLLIGFVDRLLAVLGDDIGLSGILLYGEHSDGFELMRSVGEVGPAPLESVPVTTAAIAIICRYRCYIFPDPTAEVSPAAAALLPPSAAAGIVIGNAPSRHLFLFSLASTWSHEEVDFALNTIRVALGSRLLDERVRGSFHQAAEIQRSLLVDEPPPFAGYDIAARSTPTEEVGGDLYDFIPFDNEILGVAVGDASGHGLPAALLVRDVVTGLRMGIERDMKVSSVFRKLNRVIHRSRLTSRFVSLFYGELEANGNLIYVNAGHLPPLLYLADRTVELAAGGTVMGPLAEVTFKRGFAHVDRGSTLLLYTDGIVERRDPAGEFYGRDRLDRVVAGGRHLGAAELLARIYEDVEEFGGGRPFEDDATVVVVKRLPQAGG